MFFSLVACHSGGSEEEKHQADFDKAVALFDQEEYDKAIEVFSSLKGTTVDQVIVGNYLAQSYLESAGFDVLAILKSIASFDDSAGEEEFIKTASYLIEIMPKSNLQNQEKFTRASKVFDDSKIYDFNDPLVFSYRTLYKSILLIYHLKNLGENIQVVKSLTTIREKLEYLDQIRNSEAVIQTEATIFDIVELFPNLSRKIKKIVKKIIKDGVFKFTINGKVYQLDFTNRHDGGLSRLFLDLFESQLMDFASRFDIERMDLDVSIDEVKALAHDLIYGSVSIDDLKARMSEDARILELEEKLAAAKNSNSDLLAKLEEDAAELDLDSYLEKDFDEVQDEVESKYQDELDSNKDEYDESQLEEELEGDLGEDLEEIDEVEEIDEDELKISEDFDEIEQIDEVMI